MFHRFVMRAGPLGHHAVLEIKVGIEERRLMARRQIGGDIQRIVRLAPTLEVPE